MNEIAKTLKALRIKRGLSTYQLSERTKFARPMISNIENGKGNPTLETLMTICDALDAALKIIEKKSK